MLFGVGTYEAIQIRFILLQKKFNEVGAQDPRGSGDEDVFCGEFRARWISTQIRQIRLSFSFFKEFTLIKERSASKRGKRKPQRGALFWV